MTHPVYYNPLRLFSDFAGQLDSHQEIQRLFNPAISIFDRTGTIACPVNLVNQYPIPTGNSKTFESICENRIKEILTHHGEIGVLFSGGIDSTLVAVLLFQHMKPEDRERITFFYNDASVNENKRFFEKFIQGQYKTGSSWDFDHWLDESKIVVTGECADNLFGSLTVKFLMQKLDDPKLLHKPYESIVAKLWKPTLGVKFDSIYEQFLHLAAKCPTPITTVNDWFWWLNFTMKWQAVVYRIYSHTDLSLSRNKIIHFFNTDEFQLWSLNNPDLKVKDDWYSYKWIMKDMIYHFDRDGDYHKYKVKFPSLPSMLRFKQVTDYIDFDFNKLTKSILINYINKE